MVKQSCALSIVIVNWNSRDYVRQCLRTVFASALTFSLEVIVVDNASYDGCDQLMTTEFPHVRFFQSSRNLGFARANNLGFSVTRGDAVLFLNPDTELSSTALQILWESLFRDRSVGLVGARLLNSDGTVQTSCVQRFPTILNQILDSNFLRGLMPRSRLWNTQPLFGNASAPVVVDVVSGACMMGKRIALEKVGAFTETYFMYAEDVDLCYKLHQSGWSVLFHNGAEIIHHGGKSSESTLSGFSAAMMRQSQTQFLTLSRGACYAAGYRFAIGLTAFFRLMLLFAAFLAPLPHRLRIATRNAVKKWVSVLQWSLGNMPRDA